MPQRAEIRLWSTNVENLNQVAEKIRDIAKKAGVRVKGPIPLPTKKLIVPTLRLPHGEGSKKWDKWELRIHKRLIIVDADERVMRRIMMVRVPEDVYIEIRLR
ncbi:MAG: 30S ribosomal protein S10 [Pyrodictiaceae archaeon]